jgi:DNA-directed RNA polymerase sigma subunit (sigma70/sigma32)
MEQAQATSICEAFAATLTDRELVIWNDRILLDGSTSATVTGEKLGLTKQRVGQIEKDLRVRFKAFARKELAE